MTAVNRLILVSCRGPYRLYGSAPRLQVEKTIGGLVSSLLPLMHSRGGVWIAWGEPPGRHRPNVQSGCFDLVYFSLTAEQEKGFYVGFSNNALWPLCHYFLSRVRYDPAEWAAYEEVNALFAEAALQEAKAEDVVWVHDYQLARVPIYIRSRRPKVRIHFFWHIPFPAVEMFKTLPWRRQIIESLLACDVVGFHVQEYAANFIEAAIELLGARSEGDKLYWSGMVTRVIARPIGIDGHTIDELARQELTEQRMLAQRVALGDGVLILGVERMDYTKGVLERLRGVECLLETQPAWRRRVTLLQILTPSRQLVPAYQQKKREIDEMIGRLNGRFSDGIWIPVRYQHRGLSLAELTVYYRSADIALITPLRDGLNLVAKEYVAARIHNDGVLILSEFAGAASQLPEAIITNPYSPEAVAAAIDQALRMPLREQQRRMEAMRSRVLDQDIEWWARAFVAEEHP